MTADNRPDVGDALMDAIKTAQERGRHDLIAKAVDELWLILRYPDQQFPEGPPEEVVENMRARRIALYGEGAS